MKNNSNDVIQVSNEFINEQAKLSKKVSKKAGPYNKHDRNKRRNEVFRLYFDLGYSAVKISEIMNINRNTINSDIKYCYENLSKEWQDNNTDSWIMKQICRFEFQRSRLIEYLRKESEVKNKLKIEKMIFDIDNQISQIAIRFHTSVDDYLETVAKEFNKSAAKFAIPDRIIYKKTIESTSKATSDKIWKLIDEDKKRFKI